MELTKPRPPLYLTQLNAYQRPVNWVRRWVLGFGFNIERAELDPHLEIWRFYDTEGLFILALDHTLMDRLMAVLMWDKQAVEERDDEGFHRNLRV